MYNLNSQDVATVLNNPLVFALCTIIMLVSITGILYAFYSLARMAITDFIKGYHNNIGENMQCDIETYYHNKHINK